MLTNRLIFCVCVCVFIGELRGGFLYYIASTDTDEVFIVNSTGDTLLATVSVGDGPRGVVGTPDESKVYVANRFGGNVSVIDTATREVVATVDVGGDASDVAVTPDGTRAYVMRGGIDRVYVINTATDSLISVPDGSFISLGGFAVSPTSIAITPDGTRAYVADSRQDKLHVIDTDPSSGNYNKRITTVSVPFDPEDIAIKADGTRAYVVCSGDNSVRVVDVDPASGNYHQVIGSPIAVGTLPQAIALTPDETKAYVVNTNSFNISVINLETSLVSTLTLEGIAFPGVTDVTVSPDSNLAYVTDNLRNELHVINVLTDTYVSSLSFGGFLQKIGRSFDRKVPTAIASTAVFAPGVPFTIRGQSNDGSLLTFSSSSGTITEQPSTVGTTQEGKLAFTPSSGRFSESGGTVSFTVTTSAGSAFSSSNTVTLTNYLNLPDVAVN